MQKACSERAGKGWAQLPVSGVYVLGDEGQTDTRDRLHAKTSKHLNMAVSTTQKNDILFHRFDSSGI